MLSNLLRSNAIPLRARPCLLRRPTWLHLNSSFRLAYPHPSSLKHHPFPIHMQALKEGFRWACFLTACAASGAMSVTMLRWVTHGTQGDHLILLLLKQRSHPSTPHTYPQRLVDAFTIYASCSTPAARSLTSSPESVASCSRREHPCGCGVRRGPGGGVRPPTPPEGRHAVSLPAHTAPPGAAPQAEGARRRR